MKNRLFYTLVLLMSGMTFLHGQEQSPLIGRWDIAFDIDNVTLPGWLEVSKSGHKTLTGRIMVIGGSARPVSEIVARADKWSFVIPPQWETGDNLAFTFGYENDKLTGTMRYADGKTHPWTAVRAPLLKWKGEPEWGMPIRLFSGTDLSGWKTLRPTDKNQWVADNGILRSPESGANLRTEMTFTDFQLHIEFRYPKGSNSGVYLRGRYEVQIEDNKGREANSHYFGGVYGVVSPNAMVAKDPGEWQTYDITLVGRRISVIANGEKIICDQEIPGITGGALDSNEGEPGPIYLQGDHGPIEFRNIVLIPAK